MYVVNVMTDSGISVASQFYPTVDALVNGIRDSFIEREDVGRINIIHNKNAYALIFTKRKIKDIDFSQMDEEEIVRQGHVQLFPNLQWAERSLRALEMRKGNDRVYQAVIFAPETRPDEFGEGQRRRDHTFHDEEQA